jgi:hypothetical protein
MPDGASLADTTALLDCGKVSCEISDLRRLFYIKLRGKEVLLRDVEGKFDLAKLLQCGEKYICQIDSMEKITITRKRK